MHGSGSTDLIFGRRPVFELLTAKKRSLHKLWVLEGSKGGIVEDILKAAREQNVPIEWVNLFRLDRMARGNHQGVVAQAAAVAFLDLEDFLHSLDANQSCCVVALDEIQDPQNVGAILRSAGFFGVVAALVPKWRNAPVGDTAWRVSAGGAEHVSLVRVGNLVQAIDRMKEENFEVIGADMKGTPLPDYEPHKRVLLVMGNEGKGLRRLVGEHCDRLLNIPGSGRLDSLNVGAATAIFLYHVLGVKNGKS